MGLTRVHLFCDTLHVPHDYVYIRPRFLICFCSLLNVLKLLRINVLSTVNS